MCPLIWLKTDYNGAIYVDLRMSATLTIMFDVIMAENALVMDAKISQTTASNAFLSYTV